MSESELYKELGSLIKDKSRWKESISCFPPSEKMAQKTFRPMLTYSDEAHRLNEKSDMFHNMGENQIKEVLHAAGCSVFFIDESQRVTMDDIEYYR